MLSEYLRSVPGIVSAGGEAFIFLGRTDGHLSVRRLQEIHTASVNGSTLSTSTSIYTARHDCIARYCSEEPPAEMSVVNYVEWLSRQMGNSPTVMMEYYVYYKPSRKLELELLIPMDSVLSLASEEATDE